MKHASQHAIGSDQLAATPAVRLTRHIWWDGDRVILEVSPSGRQVVVNQNYLSAAQLRVLADACMEAAAYLEANGVR